MVANPHSTVMDHSQFITIAAAIPEMRLADCAFNVSHIETMIIEAYHQGVQVMVFPELCITGYSCMDLFMQHLLIEQASAMLIEMVRATASIPMLVYVGCPLSLHSRLINAAVAFRSGKILGVVPKTYLPNYREFQEKRWFLSSLDFSDTQIVIGSQEIPLNKDFLIEVNDCKIGAEICEDLWAPIPRDLHLAQLGADVVVNLSASNELVGKNEYLRNLICQQSALLKIGYVYASAGWGESSMDLVFSGNALIAEKGQMVAASRRFSVSPQWVKADLHVKHE